MKEGNIKYKPKLRGKREAKVSQMVKSLLSQKNYDLQDSC